VHEDRDHQAVLYEMYSASRRNEEIRDELGRLYASMRANVARLLSEKATAGIVELRAEPEAIASVLFALADGFELQFTSEPGWDNSAALEAGIRTARFLLGARE
jgi:hypothetical protein